MTEDSDTEPEESGRECYHCMGLGEIRSLSLGIYWDCPTCNGSGSIG